jgi:hypothetical protein
MTLDSEGPVIRDPSLSATTRGTRALFPGPIVYRGKFKTRGNYAGQQILWKYLLGVTTVSGVSPTNKYTFSEGSPTNPTLTMEIGSRVADSGSALPASGLILSGVFITGCTIKCVAGTGPDSMLTMEWSFLGTLLTSAAGAGVTLTNVGLTANNQVNGVQPAYFVDIDQNTLDMNFGDGAGNMGLKSFEVNLNYPVDDTRAYFGARGIAPPVQNAPGTATWKFAFEFSSYSAYNKFTNAAVPDILPYVKFINPAATSRLIEIQSHTTKLTKVSQPIQGYGVIIATAELEAYYNATDLGLVSVANTSNDNVLNTPFSQL